MIISQPTRTLFNAATITATTDFIYMSEKTANLATWLPSKYDSIVIQCVVATLTASSLDIRIEGRFPASNRAASIHSYHVTSAETVDRLINISEKLSEIRIGAKIGSGNSTATNIIYSSVVFSEIK